MKYGKRRVILLILAVLLALGSECQTNNPKADEEFRKLVGPTLNDRVVLVTDKQQYHIGERIVYGVVNRTNQTLWLEDPLADLGVYRYDGASGQWEEIRLIPRSVTNPKPVEIRPNTGSLTELANVPTDNWGSQLKTTGKVRLLVHCSTDPNQPDRVDYSAYKDVEIIVP